MPKQEPLTEITAGEVAAGYCGLTAGTDASYLSNTLDCHLLERSSTLLHLAVPIR